ncbi:MAG: hypothetical protein PHD06_06440 [Bacteroidales bacterium]|jgi:hypothetical protein|nr:hypothetical protein [Bacteroidales bacterium]MDD4384800.1 hypothetical protein [Bacteroidales bacterium]MDY0198324.1 hypothetical protein [Tenuifilaceae bacterium]
MAAIGQFPEIRLPLQIMAEMGFIIADKFSLNTSVESHCQICQTLFWIAWIRKK